MDDFLAWLNRSWAVWRSPGLTLRVSLWLLIVAGLFAVQAAARFGPAWLPVAAALAVAAMVVHALAHAAAIRLVRGQVSWITASALVEQSAAFVPPRPWPLFATGIAGVLANGLLAAAAWYALPHAPAWLKPAVILALWANGLVAAINCLACSPFDGRQFWRGLLWPLLGLRRSGGAVIALGYLSAAALLVWGAWGADLLGVMMGLMCLFATIRDHRLFSAGIDPGIELVPDHPSPGIWERLNASLAEHSAIRQARKDEQEQEILDRLLAKVSAEGLPSLTSGERATLHRISQRQKERVGR